MVGAYRWMAALAAALIVPLAAPDLAAQRPAAAATAVVFGSVTDVDTGRPVAGAVVRLPGLGRSVLSDELGRFVLEQVPEGPQRIEVRRLGYAELSGELDLVDSGELVVSLVPNVIEVEGITVQVDRIATRRRSVAISTRAFDHRQISVLPPQTAREFLATHGNVFPGGRCSRGSGDCALVRGRLVPVSVFIDERPVFGGLGELDVYSVHDFAVVEMYGGGQEIRLYTPHFLDLLAQGRATLFPFILR